MPELLSSRVRKGTTLPHGFCRHAAYQAMDVYLADWRAAHARLGRAINALQELRDERAVEVERGEWPTPPSCTGVSARWCPVHGDCTCEGWESVEGPDALSQLSCPLHDPASPHGEHTDG